MGKVFTITDGLENMGAIRTGGQGSVYKGRRQGEIISAVKLLPTPIHTEDKQDKNYRDFNNEVEKLKKVNEIPNPNVVKILSSGLTESGSFPYIEMEFIEGPDLEELLQAPHDPVFSVHELVKVAIQLSNALAHCHKIGVKHGDIKSNNVKFNAHTGNYVLLDFGLAIMSDEERRTSLRRAGAVEFMAPEQNEGQMLFESDIYSFGVILYELLSGIVPFPLNDKGETARNKVMLSHMESDPPDVLEVRKNNLPKNWSAERRESEMRVPVWILEIISRCLEKNASKRFRNGVDLHEHIVQNSTSDAGNSEVLAQKNNKLQREILDLKERLFVLDEHSKNQEVASSYTTADEGKVNLSKPLFYSLLLALFGLIAFTAYSFYSRNSIVEESQITNTLDSAATDSSSIEEVPEQRVKDNYDKEIRAMIDSVQRADKNTDTIASEEEKITPEPDPALSPDPIPSKVDNQEAPVQKLAKYTLSATRAYFYNESNENSRRNNFLAKFNSPELTAINDRNGFIYVEFFTMNGEITKGWLRKRDLRRIGD